MIYQLRKWQHVFKLDPDRYIADSSLQRICCSGTDAIMFGGSSGVTYENTANLLERVRPYSLPCVLEISNREAIVPGFDVYIIPIVLNTNQAEWIVGHLHQAVKEFGDILTWEQIIVEGYVILNEYSTAAAVTQANTNLDVHDIVAFARMTEKLLQLPVLYLDYSGSFGNMEVIKQASEVLEHTRLFYGGGITNLEKARAAASVADTIIVGNVIYDDLQQALETVRIIDESKI